MGLCFFSGLICYASGIQYLFIFISSHPAVSFKPVYKLVAEHKIIQLENKWSPHKNAFFLSSIAKMLLVFVPD